MNAEIVVRRLRLFLLNLAAFILIGTVVELWFSDHLESPVQLIPFILCGSGLLAVTTVLVYPQRWSLLALRSVMGLVALGSLLGVFEHLEGNLAFELEIRPTATVWQALIAGLGGANPLLAPGILAVAAMLAIAATYHHPGLGGSITPGAGARQSDGFQRPDG